MQEKQQTELQLQQPTGVNSFNLVMVQAGYENQSLVFFGAVSFPSFPTSSVLKAKKIMMLLLRLETDIG